MPSYDRERKSSHWIWLLCFLILAVLLLVSFRDRIFRSVVETSKQGDAGFPPPSAAPSLPAGGVADDSGTRALSIPSGQTATATSIAALAPASAIAIKGIVLNESNQAAIEGAKVRIYAYASLPAVVDKTTGSEGAFAAEVPPAPRYGVKVEAEGFIPYRDDSLVVTRPSYDLQILLTPTLAIRGRVVDSQSVGIPEALVTLRREGERSPAGLTATTDPQGAFILEDIPRNGRYWAEAYHPAFDTQGMVVVTLPAESEVVIRMRPARTAGALSGTVTDSSRKPIAGARISLFDTSDGRALTRTQTDRPGTYKFAKMREGYYVVRCFADGFAETRSSQGAVMILANREARLDFNLEAGLQIRGVVVTQKGDPVLQATVFLIAEDGQRPQSSQVATTDEQGRFQVSGLRDSQYLVTVQHRDFLDLATRIRPSNQVQTLTLDGGLSLTGTISDVRGAAVGKFVMTFLSASSRYSKSCPFTTTDGRFEVRGLPRDSYLIRLQAGSNSYAGPLDLQSSTDVFISLDVPRGSRGMIPLNILKAK